MNTVELTRSAPFVFPSVSLNGERSGRSCPVSLSERFHREFARPAGLSVWSEGSPQGRDSGVRFWGATGARPGNIVAVDVQFEYRH